MTTELRPGPGNPLAQTPRLAPQSARRTWNIDFAFPDGPAGRMVTDVRGRDLVVNDRGESNVIDKFALRATVDPDSATITSVDAPDTAAPLDALIGASVLSGFGRRIAEAFADDGARRRLRYSALEDFSGAYFVSGYARLAEGVIPATHEYANLAADRQADICIGWAADGAFIADARAHGRIPVPVGPAAPFGADADGWHEMAPLVPPTVRRRRRIDVGAPQADGSFVAQEHFRDVYAGPNGETVMHEYLVDATFDGADRLAQLAVDARVLPWAECPGAARSAQRLVGALLADFATRARRELRGPATCTHLNSTMRTLADVAALVELLRR
jgi:hypothetical protein